MSTETLKHQLKELRLETAAAELDQVLSQEKKAVSLRWMIDLLTREVDHRREKCLTARIKRASFPELTSLETFDWDFNPDIDREKIEALASLEFIKRNEIALFLGKTGCGKTHLALAIGLLAVKSGQGVYCTSVKRLCRNITTARLRGGLDQLFKRILSAKLWIFDDWGVVGMPRDIAEEVFDLFDRRKHNSAMILTSNRDIDEWPAMFSEPILATATIDRMFENAEIVLFQGDSYRLRGRITAKDFDKGEQNLV